MNLKTLFSVLTKPEKTIFISALAIFAASSATGATLSLYENSALVPIAGGAYREGTVGQPIAINPIISNNPTDLDISTLIYSTLSEFEASYDIQNEGRLHLVKIHEGLKWTNGQPLTSDDIIFTIKTIQNPESKSPLYKNWEGIIAERVSELQVKFTLPTPYTFFRENFKKLSIIPKHIFGNIPTTNLKLATYNIQPLVGSGPYKFDSLSKRKDGFISQYHLVANERYHKQPPLIKDLYLEFFEVEEDMLRAFKLRQIDGFGSLSPLPVKSLGKLKQATVNITPMSRYYAVFFNPNINPLLKEGSVRNALRNAVDKSRIVREVFDSGLAKTINSPIITLDTNTPEELSPEEIKKTFERFKTSDRKISLNLVIPKINFLENTAKIIKENWEESGIDEINIITLPLDDLFENVIKTNNYEMVLFGNILEHPEDIFPFWHSSERFYPGLNLSLFKNPNADTLMEKVRQTGDGNERKEYLEKLEKEIREDTPAAFLFSLPYTYVHSQKLNGFEINNNIISSPSERFQNITSWYTETARVVKNDNQKVGITN